MGIYDPQTGVTLSCGDIEMMLGPRIQQGCWAAESVGGTCRCGCHPECELDGQPSTWGRAFDAALRARTPKMTVAGKILGYDAPGIGILRAIRARIARWRGRPHVGYCAVCGAPGLVWDGGISLPPLLYTDRALVRKGGVLRCYYPAGKHSDSEEPVCHLNK